MDSSNNLIDPEDEVKKLQELVKKLEKQNELLRTKQKLSLDSFPNANGDVEKSSLTHNNNQSAQSPAESKKDRSSVGDLDDVDVLDVDNLSLKDEEDSWLYSSPKPPTPLQSTISLYKWVRQDFDHPSPEVESARRSLLSKLDEAARMNRSSSTPALGTNMSPTKSHSTLSRSTEESQSQKHYGRPHQKQSLLVMTGNRLDNGTFNRPKKFSDQRQGPIMPDRENGDEVFNQTEYTDVETLAKQQEESLRQSMATYTSPKRVLPNKSMSIASDAMDNSGSPFGSNRSSPARYEVENSYVGRHRNSFGSDNGTPPDSPRTIQQHSTPYSSDSHQKRSISNLSRLPYPQPSSHSSDSSLEHQSAGSLDDIYLAPETRGTPGIPSPGYRAVSPAMGGGAGTALRPGLGGARGASPHRTGLPTPRRSIPRPSSAVTRSSLPLPRRSGIPSPRTVGGGHVRDESWRDGCF